MNAKQTKTLAETIMRAQGQARMDGEPSDDYIEMMIEDLAANSTSFSFDEAMRMVDRLMGNDSPCWNCGSDLAPHTIIYDDFNSLYSHETCIK